MLKYKVRITATQVFFNYMYRLDLNRCLGKMLVLLMINFSSSEKANIFLKFLPCYIAMEQNKIGGAHMVKKIWSFNQATTLEKYSKYFRKRQ